MFINLLDNALRFAPPLTPSDISARQAGGSLIVDVMDRGPGIPAGEEQRIFGNFYCVDNQSGAGSGIRLAICRGIMDLHGGSRS